MQTREFDLNIEKILEDWGLHHAIREIIANALDEQTLSASNDIEIFKDSAGKWHIKDYGRGIRYEHFTQKEDDEKLSNPHVIGKFGIGLKDALATFDRRKVNVVIKSRHSDITLGKSSKHGFDDVITLHAYISPPTNANMIGTELILDGVEDADIEKAKDLFLIFSGEEIVEKTNYGTVLEKKGDIARIYINGVKVADEESFLFSYNITSLTKKIRQALNRERSNVGRSAYSGRVKSILLSCKTNSIAENLIRDLENYSSGLMHDELKWLDVQEHAVKILNARENVVFLTSQELTYKQDMVDEARTSGYRIVTIPDNLRDKVRGQKDEAGNPIRDLGQFYTEYQESFEFVFVDPDKLNASEKQVFDEIDKIFALIGSKPRSVKSVKISETMRREMGAFYQTTGVWEPSTGTIIILRSQLSDLASFASTLLHETAHAVSNASDISREFEAMLTKFLGRITSTTLKSH